MLADTAAIHTYLDKAATEYCDKATQVFGPNIKVANGNIMTPKAQTHVSLSPCFSKEVQYGYILDDLATGYLISIGQICDDACIALFSKYKLKTIPNSMVIIEGRRNQNGLWDIPLTENNNKTSKDSSQPQTQMANGIIRQRQTKKELSRYFLASYFSSALTTLLRSIRHKHFLS